VVGSGLDARAAGYPAHADSYISDFGEVKGLRVEVIHSIKMPALVLQFSCFQSIIRAARHTKTKSFLNSAWVFICLTIPELFFRVISLYLKRSNDSAGGGKTA
jgi:hypothetical protein